MLLRKLYYLYKLRRTQYWDEDRIRSFQENMMSRLLREVYRENDFYREKWDNEGFHPDQFETLEDIKKIPYTEREEIQDNYPEKVMTDKSVFSRSTSGSSGRPPFEVSWNEQAYDFSEAVYLRALLNAGYRPWKRKSYYWYKEFDRSFYNNFFMRKSRIPSEMKPEEQLDYLEELGDDTWYYYGGILYTLAKKVLRDDRWDLHPETIITHAEILTPAMRETIEKAFGVEPHDEYGTTEFNRMAWQCEEGNYHIDSDSIYMEFEDTEHGTEPVITSLVKTGMPMIRYRMGDIVYRTDKKCECGRELPVIEPPEGRIKNFINGVSPREIIDSIAHITDFEMFQVVKDEEIILRYRPNRGFDSESVNSAREILSGLLEEEVTAEEVDYIEKTRGGKRPMVVNDS